MIDKDLPYCKDLVVSISIGWNNHIFTWEMGGSITESPYPLQELLGVGVPLVFLQVDTLKTRCNFGLALRNAGRRFFHRRIGFWWILVDEISTGNLHPCIQGGYLDFLFKRMVSRCEGSLLFFFEMWHAKKMFQHFFYKQADGSSFNPIGWWRKNLGGFTFRHFPQVASWNPLSLLTKNHQRNEGLVKPKQS